MRFWRGTASSGTERLRLYWAKASTGLSWDTQWVDYLASNCGPTKLYGAEITKPRKNAAAATDAERETYRNAILLAGMFPYYWYKQDEIHEFGPSNRHHTAAFLPWHREFINRYEVLLQEAKPTVKLLYWDWTTDPENSPNPENPTEHFNFFDPTSTSTFMGASGRGSSTPIPIGPPFNVLAPPAVTRRLSSSTTPPANPDNTLLAILKYGPFAFASDLENSPNHDSTHGYIGGGGNMSSVSTAAEDPFFFLLHTNADRLWAQWQRNTSALSRLDPATAYDDESTNANITTPLGPWDGEHFNVTHGAIEPWTEAGGYIVSKTPIGINDKGIVTDASIVFPPIYDTAPLVIPMLQPGEAVVIQIPWYPPNPADFACFGGDQGHFCLLGRIETDPTAPFGMTFPEGTDVYTNTRNNNNIAWKNVTVVDNFPGALRLSSILVRNVFGQTIQAGLRFANTQDEFASFFNFGRIFVDLKPELFKRWRQDGQVGQWIRISGDPEFTSTIEILSPAAFIQNIRLEPGEVFSVDVRFELFKDYQLPRGVLPKWDLIQTGAPDNPNAILGGQRFDVDFRKIVPLPAGREWRYLDDGSNPGPSWPSPNFDDSKWRLGKAELGFGDNPATRINSGPPDRRHITTFFRRAFEVTDPSFFRSLLLRLKRDDGAVVYLNGTEIHRVNLPGGVITPETPATREVHGLEEEMFFPFPVSLTLLRQGRNVVAVEIHQNSPRSEDLSFDLELSANPVDTRFRPDVVFASPRNGALYQTGQVIPIEVEALDSDGQITSVSLFADGALVGTDYQSPYTFQWMGASLGSHRLRAVAVDNDRQQSTVDLTITVLDNVPPIVELTEPADDAVFRVGEAIRVAAQASDPGGAVKQVEFYLRNAHLFSAPDRLVGAVEAPPYTLALTGLAPGHYVLTALARDDRGATRQSIPVHFEVLERDPTVPSDCNTFCFHSVRFYLLNIHNLPRGVVHIYGYSSPLSTSNTRIIELALKGNALGHPPFTPTERFNREFAAAQLSSIRGGGLSSPTSSSGDRSMLTCYGISFAPVQLSNGVTITPNSMLRKLILQALAAMSENRAEDMGKLADIFFLLNGDDPWGRCGR
jgi:Common central domain of tyrosinase/Bacterial Ig domain